MASKRARLIFIDGVGRTGGAILHFQWDGKGFLFDVGLDLATSGRLLTGGLRPRFSHGIDDHLKLNLLPTVEGLWRDDLMLDAEIYEDAKAFDIRGVILTHDHGDHGGGLFAVAPTIPIHCTSISAAMLLVNSVCGSGLSSETVSVVQRAPHPTEEGILHKPSGAGRLFRQVLTTDGQPSPNLCAMWPTTGPGVGLGRSDLTVAGMDFKTFCVDHSLLGACGVVVEVPNGDAFAHLGDLRRTGSQGEMTERFVRYLVKIGVRAMVIEGTRLGRENDEKNVTEEECAARIRGIVRGADKRLIIANCGGRHIERVKAFLEAAACSNRTLLVPYRLMMLMEAVGAANKKFDLTDVGPLGIYDPPIGSRPRWMQDLRERRANMLVSPREVRAAEHKYILLSNFGTTVDWLDLSPHGALFIYSNSAAYSDDARGRLRGLGEWTRRYGMSTAGIRFRGSTFDVDSSLNPSGHLHPRELASIIKRIKPEILIPCHTTHPEMFAEFVPTGTKLVLPENLKPIRF